MAEIERNREESVKRTDLQDIKEIVADLSINVKELAYLQKSTETTIEELAKAQRRTEKRLENLSGAQKRTELALKKLTEDHSETKKQLGGISSTDGYHLEDRAQK
ncbi:MAG: hypothetical protein N2513_03610 [Deltaproteobacteria bacterium]|nr:hypothetical protein [Deltaproteobacteria bacterium]